MVSNGMPTACDVFGSESRVRTSLTLKLGCATLRCRYVDRAEAPLVYRYLECQ